ncbi:MAG: hypothetical protein U0641_07295 [Anaerolineae bacterium]
MSSATIITRTDLARRTRDVVDQAQRGHIFVVESYGEEQVAILDIQDYRLLLAVASYHAQPEGDALRAMSARDTAQAPEGLSEAAVEEAVAAAAADPQVGWNMIIRAYLDGNISFGRMADLLVLSRFDLAQRFTRLGLPLRLGAANADEAKAELRALLD